MEHRQLGRSGFFVPELSFGTGTFGGEGPLFAPLPPADQSVTQVALSEMKGLSPELVAVLEQAGK